jgi:hypothetical protein
MCHPGCGSFNLAADPGFCQEKWRTANPIPVEYLTTEILIMGITCAMIGNGSGPPPVNIA